MVSAWLQTLRALRPTHVVTALPRGSSLLLLSPRDLRRVEPAPLARIEVPALFLVAPILRAARDAGALVGLRKPGALQGQGPSPGQFAAAVVRAAGELGFSAPLWLSSAPLPVGLDERAGERLRGEVQRFLDAGFTELALEGEATPSALGTGLYMVREREVPLAVVAHDVAAARPLLATDAALATALAWAAWTTARRIGGWISWPAENAARKGA